MKYAIDQIIDNIAILENIKTKERKEVSISLLPENVQEGSVIAEIEKSYTLDKNEETKRRKVLQSKLDRLKSLKNKQS